MQVASTLSHCAAVKTDPISSGQEIWGAVAKSVQLTLYIACSTPQYGKQVCVDHFLFAQVTLEVVNYHKWHCQVSDL